MNIKSLTKKVNFYKNKKKWKISLYISVDFISVY